MVARNKKNWNSVAGDFIQRAVSFFHDGRANPAVMKKVPTMNDQIHFFPPRDIENLQVVAEEVFPAPSPLDPWLARQVKSKMGICKKQDFDWFFHSYIV